MFFQMLSFVSYSLIVDKFFVRFEKNNRFFKVTKESLDKAGNQMRVLNMLQIFIISFTELI